MAAGAADDRPLEDNSSPSRPPACRPAQERKRQRDRVESRERRREDGEGGARPSLSPVEGIGNREGAGGVGGGVEGLVRATPLPSGFGVLVGGVDKKNRRAHLFSHPFPSHPG